MLHLPTLPAATLHRKTSTITHYLFERICLRDQDYHVTERHLQIGWVGYPSLSFSIPFFAKTLTDTFAAHSSAAK